MGKASITAAELRIAKLEADIAEAKASVAKKKYEALRQQMVNDMVSENFLKFEIKADDDFDGMSFRLETKQRWSPVVEAKDVLYENLRAAAPELFSITAAALTKYCNDLCEQNGGDLPPELEGLVKKYDDTHVVVRTIKR